MYYPLLAHPFTTSPLYVDHMMISKWCSCIMIGQRTLMMIWIKRMGVCGNRISARTHKQWRLGRLTSHHHSGFAKFSYLHCLIIKIVPNVSWVSVCMCFCCVLCLAFCCVDYDRSCVHVCGVCRDQSDQGPVLWGVHACLNMDPARPIGHFRSPTHLLPTASSHLMRFRHMSLSEKLVWQTI